MDIINPQWPKKDSETKADELFKYLLFFKRAAYFSVERLRLTKELERLLLEDQTKFAEYLSVIIGQYENECGPVLNVNEDEPGPVIEELESLYFDETTSSAQYLYQKSIFILGYLKGINTLWEKKQIELINKELKETHILDVNEIRNAKVYIEDGFIQIENLTLDAIRSSSDNEKNETLKESLENMRNDLKSDGFNV